MAWKDEVINAGGILPDNYLPVALSYMNKQESRSRVLLPRLRAMGTLDAVRLETVSEDTIADPAAMAEVTGGNRNLLIGPFARGAGDLAKDPLFFPPRFTEPATVVIVDIGIAFWDRSFYPSDPPLFEAVVSMDFDGGKTITTSRTRDQDPAFFKKVEAIYAAEGNRGVFAYLAGEFPGSIYNPGPGQPRLGPSDFAHGTAMASIVAEGKPGTRLIAFELPAEAYLDRAGKSLRAILPTIMAQIEVLTKDASGPIYVLLPYAYLRGPVPHDRSPVKRPVLDDLEGDLARGKSSKSMFLPVGNFLQEQLHARLKQGQAITWSIPAEDPSPNTLSFHWAATCNDPVTLTLVAPGGDKSVRALSGNDFLRVSEGAKFVAAAVLRQTNGWWRLDVSLAPTKPKFGAVLPGLYSVSLDADHALRDQHVFVHRDDQPGLSALVPSVPQSFLVDPGYKRRGRYGRYLLDDREHPNSAIRREGTASHLVLGCRTNRRAVVADIDSPTGTNKKRRAEYASLFQQENKEANLLVETVGSMATPGRVVRSNGAGRFDRMAGTSVAVALAVNRAL